MGIERIIREQIYLYKRRQRLKTHKPSYHLSRSNKRLLALVCILIGVLLMLSQCSKIGEEGKRVTMPWNQHYIMV